VKLPLEPPFAGQDPGGMLARVVEQPQHIAAALGACEAQSWPPPIASPDAVVIAGMGGSAIGGELTAAAFAAKLPRPVVVLRGYTLPAWVGANTLVVLSSYSGNTEETLAIEAQARERGAPRMMLASGGTLAARAKEAGAPLHVVPGGMPPRAALFHGWVPLTMLMHRLGWAEDPRPLWRESLKRLEKKLTRVGPDVEERRNKLKRLARRTLGKRLYVYSGSGPMAAVALRFRQQLNENSKRHAVQAVVPELSHNEVVAWQATRRTLGRTLVFMLRDRSDPLRERQRLDHLAGLLARAGTKPVVIEEDGPHALVRMASAIQTSDLLSVYAAFAGDVDPTDIRFIDELKHWLTEQPTS